LRSGIILAGGKSSRMGKEIDKGLMDFSGKPLIVWVLEILSPVVDELIISLSEGKKSEYLEIINVNVKVVEDIYPNIGPLGGLLSSFSKASGDYIAVAPCDSPFIVPKFYPLLFELAKDHDGAVPKLGKYYEPLHAVYKRKSTYHAMKKAFKIGKLKPIDAYQYLNLTFASEKHLGLIDPNLTSFTNINTILDLNNSLKNAKKYS
jgi:molybdopterin-guanine dinucleotide biosynthesis protein A